MNTRQKNAVERAMDGVKTNLAQMESIIEELDSDLEEANEKIERTEKSAQGRVMKLTSHISNTEHVRFAFRFWRLGFGMFKPGGKEGLIAIYQKNGAGDPLAGSLYRGRVYFRIGQFALVWCIKGWLSYWYFYWPRNKWM